MTRRRVARVLIDSPLPQLDRLFDYTVPDEFDADAQPGVRVKVPLRTVGRMVEGFIVERAEEDDADRPLSAIEAVVSPVPVLTPLVYRLARKAADRAAGSASDILRLAIPKRMVRAEKAWLAAGGAGSAEASPEHGLLPAPATEALDAFPELAEALVEGRRVAVSAPPQLVRTAAGADVGAWARLMASAAALTLSRRRSAILIVPDHRDQAQLVAALADVAPTSSVVEVDARQSSPERYAAFLRTLSPAPCIVVGNRSAVYAPAHEVGLIALWDDGDPLLAEPLSPGVHARDAALLRQELEGSSLLLAGHTRTTDVERLIAVGWVTEVSARRRTAPRIVLSPSREGESRGARVPSAAFAAAREAAQNGPVLVQVARPGYAPTLVCATCRQPARCAHCSGPLQSPRPGVAPVCGWCGRTAHRWACPSCSGTDLRMTSSGSRRTADELGRAFPGVRVIVSDGEHTVLHVDDRPSLVVATRGAEPMASGGYRAVVLLDGERMLLADDLRIAESCLRWWSDAAALAGPGAPVHLVGVDGQVAKAFATWTQPAYARSELTDRTTLRMPPAVRVASLKGPVSVVRDVTSLLVRDAGVPQSDVLGPVETPNGVRSLVRFDYSAGSRVTDVLRAALVADAVRARSRRGPQTIRNTLRLRVDMPDLDL
jgi:primosomal protein N' (replication factor Y)